MNRWDRCIVQRGTEVNAFLRSYLTTAGRRLFLIAGGGFDPRSTVLGETLVREGEVDISTLLIREERPNAAPALRERADANCARFRELFPDTTEESIRVFADDNAVIGGREIARVLSGLNLAGVTDVLLDISALSTGVFFPAARFLYEAAEARGFNLHLFVTEEPTVDHGIIGNSCDMPGPLHGFRGRLGLESSHGAAKLWLPQLVPGRTKTLDHIFRHFAPDDVCPILPFPSVDPRLPDLLVNEYREQLSTWGVDFRNCFYAAENDPLDLYRTILRIESTRQRVFAEAGGSLVAISPTGSKILSVGALLAALEKDLPVMLIESVGYEVNLEAFERSEDQLRAQNLVHLWIAGEACRVRSFWAGVEAAAC